MACFPRRLPTRHENTLALGVLCCLLGVLPAAAQSPALAAMATYSGPDRVARLIEGARKEGAITLYTALVSDDMNPVIAAFKKEYGLDVNVWRASDEELVLRGVTEGRSGRCPADVFHSGFHALEPLRREHLLQPIQSPSIAALIPQARGPDGAYAGVTVNVFTAAYNTDLVKPEEAPKSYTDLESPRWKGRVAIEADDASWLAAVVNKLGEHDGLALLRTVSRTTGITLRKGHTLLTRMVAAGEVPIALTGFSYRSDQLARAGAPIRTLYLAPVIANAIGIAVSRCTAHPNSAILFHEFMLTKAQAILGARGMVTADPTINPPPPGIELTFMDPNEMMEHGAKWSDLWQKTMIDKE